MLCPEGRVSPPLYDCRARSCFMDGLYACKTRRLSALGRDVGESHQTCVKESFTRIRSTFTHWAGDGSRAGLWHTNCWQRWRFPAARNARSASKARVDMIGSPGSHALPRSITIEPSEVSISRRIGANDASHALYASPLRLP